MRLQYPPLTSASGTPSHVTQNQSIEATDIGITPAATHQLRVCSAGFFYCLSTSIVDISYRLFWIHSFQFTHWQCQGFTLLCTSQFRAITKTRRCIWKITTTIRSFKSLVRILRLLPTSHQQSQHLGSATNAAYLSAISIQLTSNVGAAVPDNSLVHWNCQDYVMEVLEKFEEECIVDADDEVYIDVKKRLMEQYGPV